MTLLCPLRPFSALLRSVVYRSLVFWGEISREHAHVAHRTLEA